MDNKFNITAGDILEASRRLSGVVRKTPTDLSENLSTKFQAEIYLKREDLQKVRSYKIRGAYNKITSHSKEEQQKGIVCASAGNHAQGVALTCQLLDIQGHIFMPTTTPNQKVKQVKMFGKQNVTVHLTGDTFDDASAEAQQFCEAHKNIFVPPFDDREIVCGQGTVGLEIIETVKKKIDYLFVPIGGGGLASGISLYFDALSPETKIIGVEPAGAPAMKTSIEKGENTRLAKIDKFVDGAAVQRVGDLNFKVCQEYLEDIVLVPEGKICSTILSLYNEEAIVVEPAGALTVSALDFYKEEIKGKNVVCIVSGSNNDIDRMQEIKERSQIYEGLKHYFIVHFPQRAGALREYLSDILGENDDITFFEYTKKNSRAFGSAIVGIELKNKKDYEPLIERMTQANYKYTTLNDKPELFNFLV